LTYPTSAAEGTDSVIVPCSKSEQFTREIKAELTCVSYLFVCPYHMHKAFVRIKEATRTHAGLRLRGWAAMASIIRLRMHDRQLNMRWDNALNGFR
jgi:hypothetical protein